jgi:hypothetical protein
MEQSKLSPGRGTAPKPSAQLGRRSATERRSRRKRWRALSWFTLDNVSKIAAIGTPILVGLVGWYSTDVWKARDENISTYEKTSSAIGKLSVLDTTGQRDAVFSTIQLGRADLLKRVSSYIEARITTEMDNEKEKLSEDRTISSPIAHTQALRKIITKYRELRSEIFLPLVLGAIAAGDISVVQSIVEAVPGVLELKRSVPINNDLNVWELWNLLDHAVQARSEPLVRYFINKGMQVNYWTVKIAIHGGDDSILDLVGRSLPKNFGIVKEVWKHAAQVASSSQIRVLTQAGLGKAAVGAPINEIISIAANRARYEVLDSLFDAGFSPYAATLDQRKEVMNAVAEAYLQAWLAYSVPDLRPFAKTIRSLCRQYMKEGITISRIAAELELGGDTFDAEVAPTEVLRILFGQWILTLSTALQESTSLQSSISRKKPASSWRRRSVRRVPRSFSSSSITFQ